MRIGEVASLGGVRAGTLRYYERRGLIARPSRTGAGYRAYSQDVVAQLRLIRWAKGLGFTRAQVTAKIQEIDSKMEQLGCRGWNRP